jgi:catechol 2,3-dioxygenase-like lactoylglutathione lyase family enzyme
MYLINCCQDSSIIFKKEANMLGDKRVVANLTVSDLDRAIQFYTDKLGLKLVRKSEWDANLSAGEGSMIDIYLKPNSTCDNTSCTFMVEDINREMEQLSSKGITFEEYDMPDMGIKTVNGVADMNGTKSAWFKDSEGNIIALIEGAM